MGKRRTYFTVPRKSSSNPSPRPTPALRIGQKWMELQRFDEYPVNYDEDSDSRPEWVTRLKADDTVLVRGINLKKYGQKDYPDCDFWVLHIRDFALSDVNEGEIWIRGVWFYSAQHAKELDKSFNNSNFAQYELFRSKHEDCIKPENLHGPTIVYNYTEDAVDQGPINTGEFFTRRRYDHIKKKLYPEQGNTGCRDCHGPYNPDDTDTTYYFCPRPSCHAWYHEHCLGFRQSWSRDRTLDSHAMELLCSNPDEDDSFVFPGTATATSSTSRLENIRKSKLPKVALLGPRAVNMEVALGSLPVPLVKLARCQIVKGPSVHGISGNVGDVVDARRIIYRCLTVNNDEAKEDLEEWMRVHGVKDEPGASGSGRVSKKAKVLGQKGISRPYICPRCGGAI